MGILEDMNAKLDLILAKLDQKPIEKPVKPIEHEKPPVVTPMPPIIIDEVFNLDDYLKDKEGVVRMPERMPTDKEVVFRSNGMIKPKKSTVLLGNHILVPPSWKESPTQLFDTSGCQEFSVSGIAFVTPPNRPIVTGFPDKELFGWSPNSILNGAKFAWINAPEIKDKERVTYGLCRFGYSTDSDKNIYLIGKNLHHNGFNFTQLKNPHRGNVYLALLNCSVHNPIIEQPQSHYYSPTRIKVRVLVQGGVAKIISDNTYDQIKTWVGFNNGNQRSILHFDRYVYDISESKLIDNKTLIIDQPDEFQCGDNIQGQGEVIQKQIDFTRKKNWEYTCQYNDLPTRKTLPEGEFVAYIVYKGNAGFSSPFVTKDTKFGDWYVTMSQGYGWTVYNEEHSGYFENYHGQGFHWNSGGSIITNGLIIKNSTFEGGAPTFNVKPEGQIDPEVTKHINYLESL